MKLYGSNQAELKTQRGLLLHLTLHNVITLFSVMMDFYAGNYLNYAIIANHHPIVLNSIFTLFAMLRYLEIKYFFDLQIFLLICYDEWEKTWEQLSLQTIATRF